MPRYIDADAIMKQLARKKAGPANKRYTEGFNDALMSFRSMVHSAPTLSPDEVRGVGEWIEYHADYKCTACGETVKDEIFYMLDPYRLPTYCPNCGAKMKGAETSE